MSEKSLLGLVSHIILLVGAWGVFYFYASGHIPFEDAVLLILVLVVSAASN